MKYFLGSIFVYLLIKSMGNKKSDNIGDVEYDMNTYDLQKIKDFSIKVNDDIFGIKDKLKASSIAVYDAK